LTVLGADGAYPAAGGACSGFLVEVEGFRILLDVGYATVPRLLSLVGAAEVDAVLVTHGHPDHCADLNPLLRARALVHDPAPPLPVYAPAGALDAVLALDRPGMLDAAVDVRVLADGERVEIGPFTVDARLLPHSRPNLGYRLAAGGAALAYTGDTGPSPQIAALARGADLLLAEASYVEPVPPDNAGTLSSACEAGGHATAAGVGALLLTHLFPGTDPVAAAEAAAASYAGPVGVASWPNAVTIGQVTTNR
jgi:ribonuclease BN (tRNA processing enzyme)